MIDKKAKRYIEISKAMDRATLYDWYISSIDETIPPIWTDEHIEELSNDFYIISKDTTFADVEEVKHGKWEKAKRQPTSKNFICSACHGLVSMAYESAYGYYRYCPNCGAKMDKECDAK